MTDEPEAPNQAAFMASRADGIAGPFSNKFHISVDSTHVRLIFGQQFLSDEPAIPHSKIVVGIGDARELAEAILNLVGKIQEEAEDG